MITTTTTAAIAAKLPTETPATTASERELSSSETNQLFIWGQKHKKYIYYTWVK